MATPITGTTVTTEWLNGVIGHLGEVTACERHGLGAEETGFLSTMLKVELTWAQPNDDLPQTVVVKLPPPPGEFEKISEQIHVFQREVRFYKEIAPTVPTRVPTVFYTSATPGHEVLVMEDLSWMTPCDQVVGMGHDWVSRTVAEIGSLQARYWDTPDVAKLDWIPWEWKDNMFSLTGHEEWEAFRQRWGDIVGPRGLEIADRVERARDWIDDRLRSRPKTIVHNDLRADNILMDESGPEPRACVIDWQLLTRGLGVADVAHLLGSSDPPEDRSGHQLEVLRAWHDALVIGGVHDYSFEEASEDLLLAILVAMRVPAFVSKLSAASADETTRTGKLIRAIVCRLIAFVDELDALRVLPR